MTDTGETADEGGGPEDRVQDRPHRPSTVGAHSPPQQEGQRNSGTETPLEGRGGPAPRQLLGNRYRLLGRLGQGGMGTVWKAHDEVIGRDVAVKEPRLPSDVPDHAQDVVFARLEREARAAAQVDHPSVVSIYDVVSVEGQPWIVMELIRGQSLEDVLTQGTLPPAEAARVALHVLGALAAAHALGVLHRDVKPPNIMLGRSGRIVLTDFGIAHIEGETSLTQTGALVGSPEYTAPERVLGQAPGPESDLFSLGALLYTATEGFSPFRRQLPQATFQAVLRSEPQQPEQAGELAPLIMRLLSKEPRSRPTALAARELLERITAHSQVQPSPVPLQQFSYESQGDQGVARTGGAETRNESRNRAREWAWPIGAAVIGSVVTGSLVAALLWPDADERSEEPAEGQAPVAQGGESSAIPDGWKREAVKKLGVSVAVPENYERSQQNSENAMTFRENGRAGRQLILVRNGETAPKGSPSEVGAFWYSRYMRNPDFRDTRVTLAQSQGPDGKEGTALTMTFRSKNDPQLHRKRELYFKADGASWTLVVDWNIPNERSPGGDRLFDGAAESFRPL